LAHWEKESLPSKPNKNHGEIYIYHMEMWKQQMPQFIDFLGWVLGSIGNCVSSVVPISCDLKIDLSTTINRFFTQLSITATKSNWPMSKISRVHEVYHQPSETANHRLVV
jgi:hypothetical protein